jgi:hypothetical protein
MEDEHCHVATTTAPAMTFAQLMELTRETATIIALIKATIRSLKEATTANVTSIANLKAATTANVTSFASLMMVNATFIASLTDRTAVVEAQSCHITIVVRVNDKFIVTPAALPNHMEAAIRQVQAMPDLLAAPLNALLCQYQAQGHQRGDLDNTSCR